MNLRESIEKTAETIMDDQLCASEAHCLLTEALKCPDIILFQEGCSVGKSSAAETEQYEDLGIEVVENAPVLL